MAVVVDEAAFRLTHGEVKTCGSKSDSGRTKYGAFCPLCGTRVYHKSEWRRGTISVKAGTLDDTSWLRPKVHLWTSKKQEWVTIPEGVEAYEQQP